MPSRRALARNPIRGITDAIMYLIEAATLTGDTQHFLIPEGILTIAGDSVMTTNPQTAEDRLAKLGIGLPEAPAPFGAYVPAVQTGNLLFLSGMLATSGHAATMVGIVGKDLDINAGRKAAYTAALNVLALTKKLLGSLNRVTRVVRLGVSVAATAEFTEHAKVADAASELLRDVFGDETMSCRLVFGVASLPLGSPVELEVILEVKP